MKIIAESTRNIYPVLDIEGNFKGIIRLDDIRSIMFKSELYKTTSIASLMVTPEVIIDPDESMEVVAIRQLFFRRVFASVAYETETGIGVKALAATKAHAQVHRLAGMKVRGSSIVNRRCVLR